MSDRDGVATVRVRVLAPGRDGTLTCQVLSSAQIDCVTAATVEELCRDPQDSWVLIVAEEALTRPGMDLIVDRLSGQPPWSDLPIIVVTRPGGRAGQAMRAVGALGNVSVLDRPVCIDALVTAVRAGIRARRRQFQLRDVLRDRAEADRRKDEFLAMLAHELRNPLAPIRSGVGLMRMLDLRDPDLVETCEILDRQVRHMSRLIDDLLDVSRITRGTIQLRKARVDLIEVARQAARMVGPAMDGRGHDFVCSLPASPLPIEADPTRIEQVIANVLANAAKYTEPGGTVRLTVEEAAPAQTAVIRVEDNGVGIDPQVLPRIFDLFAQADRTLDRAQGGLGVGLTIVHRLVALHGGTVEARSDGPGRGTTMVVRLPVASEPADGSGSPDGPAGATTARASRILLVEDNHDAADMLARALRRHGHDVCVVHDGTAALETAPEFRPHAILTDIGLPGMDGFEVARRLRREPNCASSLLVAISGYGQAEDRRMSREAGCDHHLIKPIQIDELIGLLDRASHADGDRSR